VPRLTRAESAARTRTLLLRAAEDVFAERGFTQASLEEIAEQAGFSRGAVYANFANKTELFLALLDDWLSREIAEAEALLRPDVPPEQAINSLHDHGGNRFADRQRYLLLAEFRLYALRHPDVRDRLQAYERASRAWFARAVHDSLRSAGLAPPASAEQIGLIALALENGIATLTHLDPDGIPRDAFPDALALIARALTALAEQQDPATVGRPRAAR
jgi:AcrR family transcriptional regulator